MASLKDLKNRIASVKSTQKITKAMQMVAAAKLRRAQETAEAARPYAERMGNVLASLGAAYAGRSDAPALLGGNGRDQVHLLVVATGERGLAGGFNSSIARMARDAAVRLLSQGKTVKFLTVGRKGNDILKRTFAERIVDAVSFRDVRTLGFTHAESVGRKIIELYEAGEFDVATLFFARFRSVISQMPTALQLIPAQAPDVAPAAAALSGTSAARQLRVRARRRGDPARSPAAQHFHPGVPRHAREPGVVLRCADERHGQRHAQCRRHDPEAAAGLQPPASGTDHQRTDRNYLGRGSALATRRTTPDG